MRVVRERDTEAERESGGDGERAGGGEGERGGEERERCLQEDARLWPLMTTLGGEEEGNLAP